MGKADTKSAHRNNRNICLPFSQEVYNGNINNAFDKKSQEQTPCSLIVHSSWIKFDWILSIKFKLTGSTRFIGLSIQPFVWKD